MSILQTTTYLDSMGATFLHKMRCRYCFLLFSSLFFSFSLWYICLFSFLFLCRYFFLLSFLPFSLFLLSLDIYFFFFHFFFSSFLAEMGCVRILLLSSLPPFLTLFPLIFFSPWLLFSLFFFFFLTLCFFFLSSYIIIGDGTPRIRLTARSGSCSCRRLSRGCSFYSF